MILMKNTQLKDKKNYVKIAINSFLVQHVYINYVKHVVNTIKKIILVIIMIGRKITERINKN